MPATKRLFIGLELPDDVRHALASIDHRVDGVRWVRDDLLHLTITFLGGVDRDAELHLRTALRNVRVDAFTLHLVGVGVFGGARPRVVWAGLSDTPAALRRLHAAIADAVAAARLHADAAPFHPHVTLGRLRDGRRQALQPFLDRYATTDFGAWAAGGFVLFRSDLTSTGPAYSVELRLP